jgi:hypothetical protein
VILSILTYVAMHLKSNDDVSLSLFELPKNLPYLYCEFNEYPDITGVNGKYVLFVFWQNNKMHQITGTAVNEEWNFKAYTPDAQQVIDHATQMHARKTRIMPKPGERNVEGRILAADAGLISRISHAPRVPVYFKAELIKPNDDEYNMNFDILNIESVIPTIWLRKLSPINIENLPLAITKGVAYAQLALNITLMELIPQYQMFISKNAKNRNAASLLRSMSGELYVAVGSGSALWDGISTPTVSCRFYLKNNTMKQALFDFIYDLYNRKYELSASNDGYYSYAPSSLWLSQSKDFLETGIIDRRSTAKNGGSTLPEPPKEALLWLSFSPRYLAEVINSFLSQIDPDLDLSETLDKLAQVDSCTLTLDSIQSGTIKWKTLTPGKE